jgi:hypothetical protein
MNSVDVYEAAIKLLLATTAGVVAGARRRASTSFRFAERGQPMTRKDRCR